MRDMLPGLVLLMLIGIAAVVPALASGERAASGGKSTPVPTVASTATPIAVFPKAERPIEFVLPGACQIEAAGMHADHLGATWTIQCGSATANRAVAESAVAQGWQLLSGNPPIGVGLQNYLKRTSRGEIWMQIAFRLDGPALADHFVLVQTLRSPTGP